jgi:imidazole glycerol phosphate synthase glutamine amidotransferase subunit
VTPVAIVPTGTANTASVVAALERLGAVTARVGTPREVAEARALVLPGVGAFGAAMGQVEAMGLAKALRERIESGLPSLAICVGMQLLGNDSEESPGAPGLGVVDSTVRRFRGRFPIPQLGWNQVTPAPGSKFLEPGWGYFANSYRMEQAPQGWVAAISEYGGEFVSAMERESVLACQFHPELSGPWGSRLLGRWLEVAA